MAARLCFVLLLVALSVDSTRQVRTRVETRNGAIEGRTLTVQVQNTNVEVDEFLGIPYAEPPVGDLRFRRPVPAGRWEGTYQAKTPPNSCMQVSRTFIRDTWVVVTNIFILGRHYRDQI